MSNQVYKIVTDRLIAQIEEAIKTGGTLPWRRSWDYRSAPINHCSLRRYSGCNLWLLRQGGEYLTWSQLTELQHQNPNIKLRKGSKPNLVIYFSFKTSTKEVVNANGQTEEKETQIPILRYYHVFDIQDVDGLTPRRPQIDYQHEPIEEAEAVMEAYLNRESTLKLHFNDGEKACYRPSADEISVPSKELFKNLAEYYSTLFHESIHSTGHSKRLNRLKSPAYFGDESYSKEELIAEMGSSILSAYCGIDNSEAENNSVAYLQGWLAALKNDVTLLVSASAKAQKAVDFILGVSTEE